MYRRLEMRYRRTRDDDADKAAYIASMHKKHDDNLIAGQLSAGDKARLDTL